MNDRCGLCGREVPPDAQYAPYQERVDGALRRAGYRDGRSLLSRTYPGADHSERAWRARFGREMDISYIVNQRIARWSDTRWDEGVEMLRRLTPAQAADLLRGDYSVGLLLGVLRRNPGLLRTGAKKFFDLALERLGRNAPVTEAEVLSPQA